MVCQAHKNLQTPRQLLQTPTKHQVPKTWVKQHPKTAQPTKTNENPSPSSSMHKLVSNWFLSGSYGSDCSYQLHKVSYYVHMHMHCSKIGLKHVQVGSRWFSTLYILSPNFHTPSWTVVLYTEVAIG